MTDAAPTTVPPATPPRVDQRNIAGAAITIVLGTLLLGVVGFGVFYFLNSSPHYRAAPVVSGQFSFTTCMTTPDGGDKSGATPGEAKADVDRFKICTPYVEDLVKMGVATGPVEALWFLRARLRDLEASAANNGLWARERFINLTWMVLSLAGLAWLVTLVVIPAFKAANLASRWGEVPWGRVLAGIAAITLAFLASFGYAKQYSTNFQLELSLRSIRDTIDVALVKAHARAADIQKMSAEDQAKARATLENELSKSVDDFSKDYVTAMTAFASTYGSSFVLPVVPPGS
ncbi:hypothetical protein [Labrys neptuniae]